MRRRAPSTPDLLVPLDGTRAKPLSKQLYEGVRDAVLQGRLAAGARLPSSRTLARDLGISRNTVLLSLDQLRAEGYVEDRTRVGTFVTRNIPDALLGVERPSRHSGVGDRAPRVQASEPRLGVRGAAIAAGRMGIGPRVPVVRRRPARSGVPFRPGVPAVDEFPRALWARLVARRWRQQSLSLGYGDPRGYTPLRRAIAEYLRSARGAHCDAEQVIVVSGAQQALDIAARLLLDPGDVAWVEDPGYHGAHEALRAVGATLVGVPVDAEGLSVAAGIERAPMARLAVVTPSHQFPLGTTMSVARRLALLAWARNANAWIVEDDYDSEFRYTGRPLACLQGLDTDGRVLYTGTFSKTLCPALRLGYLVVPPALVEAVAATRAVTDRHPPTVTQATVADFLEDGHFARHVRRMRSLYAERQKVVLEALWSAVGEWITVGPSPAGLHLVGWLRSGMDDVAVSDAAWAAGVIVPPVSHQALSPLPRGGLMFGYAGHLPSASRAGAAILASVLAAGWPRRG